METNPNSLAGIMETAEPDVEIGRRPHPVPFLLRSIVPDELLDNAFDGTTTEPDEQREEVKSGLIKCAAGMIVNKHLVKRLCKLGLVFNANTLTEKGRRYLNGALVTDQNEFTLDAAMQRVTAGNAYPYDAPDNWWRNTTAREIPPRNWAHAAARGVMAELRTDPNDIHRIQDADQIARDRLVHMLELIIRAAHINEKDFENKEPEKEKDDEN